MTPEWQTRYQRQLFHGCAEDVISDIAQRGFLTSKQKSATGAWQRFGPGFYFALQASKSHEYPKQQMHALPAGSHQRSMLLCKVAVGKAHETTQNMSDLPGKPPAGFHSVYGKASAKGPLNYDEIVVYEPAAIYPWLKVTYEFVKL